MMSLLIAIFISSLNVAIALIVIKYAAKKKKNDFIKYVLGSMVARYFLMVVLVWICLAFLELNRLIFGLTFLISTFILIFGEILYINYRSSFLD